MCELMNIEETAKYLRMSVPTIRNWIVQGRFPTVKVSGKILIKREDLEKFINDNTRPVKEIGNAKS